MAAVHDAASSKQSDRLSMIGRMLGRYAVTDVLGEGGMGLVYRARDTLLGRQVALKVIHRAEGQSQDQEHTRRLLREAQAAAALNHPNAVSIFDLGEADGVAFVALELVTAARVAVRSKALGSPEL
jgi:eukaryotic-like serine/threonine-protein kinase